MCTSVLYDWHHRSLWLAIVCQVTLTTQRVSSISVMDQETNLLLFVVSVQLLYFNSLATSIENHEDQTGNLFNEKVVGTISFEKLKIIKNNPHKLIQGSCYHHLITASYHNITDNHFVNWFINWSCRMIYKSGNIDTVGSLCAILDKIVITIQLRIGQY